MNITKTKKKKLPTYTEILEKYWGYNELKDKQIIEKILSKSSLMFAKIISPK